MQDKKRARLWQERATNAEIAAKEARSFLQDMFDDPGKATEDRARRIMARIDDIGQAGTVSDPTEALAELKAQAAVGPGVKVLSSSQGSVQATGGPGARVIVKAVATARPGNGQLSVAVGGGPGSKVEVRPAVPRTAPELDKAGEELSRREAAIAQREQELAAREAAAVEPAAETPRPGDPALPGPDHGSPA